MNDLGTRLFVALCILLIGGYFIGLRLNRRSGRELARWVREGLTVTGGEATIRWLGSSGFVIAARRMAAPFAHLEATALLLPREVALLWLYYRLRGRRDLLVLRCHLINPPRHDVEIVAPRSPFGGAALARIEAAGGWTVRSSAGVVIAAPAGGEVPAERLWSVFKDQTAGLWHLSVRGKEPHLQVGLSVQATADAKVFWRRLADAARIASGMN